MSEDLYMGVECVGLRHSTAVLSDGNGNILGARRIPNGVSLHTTARSSLRCRLAELIFGVLQEAGLNRSVLRKTRIFLGLTGVTFPYDALRDLPLQLHQSMSETEIEALACTGDAEIIFAGMAQESRGTAIISHMGSAAYISLDSCRRHRFGGWGPILGDEGSGYSLGLEVFRTIAQEYDRREEPSILWKEVVDWLKAPFSSDKSETYSSISEWETASYSWRKLLQDFEECRTEEYDLRTAIFAFSHTLVRERDVWAWRSITSSLTVPLFRCLARGDSQSECIVRNAARQLAQQHREVCIAHGETPSCGPLVLAGGVINHHPDMARMIIEEVYNLWPNKDTQPLRVIFPLENGTMRPAFGALLFALGRSDSKRLQFPTKEIVDHLQCQVESKRWPTLIND